MKKFQKVAAMLLGLTMSVSLFACGGSGDDSSKENGSDNILGIELPGNLEEGEGEQYLDGAVEAFKAANTVTIEYTMSASWNSTVKTPYAAAEETDGVAMGLNFKATLAKAEEGYNIAIEATSTEQDWGEEVMTSPFKVYIVDGYVYEYDYDEETWDSIALEELVGDYVHDYDIEPLTSVEEDKKLPDRTLTPWATLISTAIMSVVSGDIADVDFSAVYDILGPVVEALAFIENSEYKFNLDAKEDVTTALQTLANIDYTQTVEAYINNALKESGSKETVKSILDEIASYGAKTVGEIYKDFNETLKTETGKDLNGLKAELVAKLKEIDLTVLEAYIPAEELMQVNAIITQIEAFDIDEMIKPYEKMTIDELLSSSMGGDMMPYAAAPEASALKSITDMIYTQLQTMTLQQALYSMDMNEIMELSKQAKYVSVSDLSEKLSIKFNGYKFSSMNFEAKVGGSYNNTSDATAIEKIAATLSTNVACKVNFSSETTTITAPVIAE